MVHASCMHTADGDGDGRPLKPSTDRAKNSDFHVEYFQKRKRTDDEQTNEFHGAVEIGGKTDMYSLTAPTDPHRQLSREQPTTTLERSRY